MESVTLRLIILVLGWVKLDPATNKVERAQ